MSLTSSTGTFSRSSGTLEREEEKLQANGFYDGKSDMVRTFTYLYILYADVFLQFDSDDERKAAEMKVSREKHDAHLSTATDKEENHTTLPCTVGLCTLSEPTTSQG